jgi:hypothetical protein
VAFYLSKIEIHWIKDDDYPVKYGVSLWTRTYVRDKIKINECSGGKHEKH